jgi:hypothetical protein
MQPSKKTDITFLNKLGLNDRNVFCTSEQAVGSRALAMLSQQLADVNGGWNPKWSSDEVKYCIVRSLYATF